MVSSDGTPGSESIEWVSISSISTDRRVNTRPVDVAWVDQKLAKGFNPDGIGIPIVSHRDNGTYIWLDGQNRGELMRRAGWGDQKIQCRVFYGLTLAQEAQLFLVHNDNRRVTALSKFLARVTAEDTTAVTIVQVASRVGWKVGEAGADGVISAVAALEKVFRMDQKEEHPGGDILELTLRVVTEAWGYKSDAVDGRILYGIGALLNRFGDSVNRAALIKKLAEFPAGPSGVLGKARGMQSFQGGTVVHCVAEVIVNAYNARRRTNVLPDWR
jgi:hypothetical protein